MKNQLKVLRAMRNWSQADLGEHLDVSRQAVNAIETGKYDPSLPLAFKIARLFHLPIEEIFDDEFDEISIRKSSVSAVAPHSLSRRADTFIRDFKKFSSTSPRSD